MFYAFLVYRGVVEVGWEAWLLISVFLLVEVVHNDFLRIALNELGVGLGERWKRVGSGKSATTPPPAAGNPDPGDF